MSRSPAGGDEGQLTDKVGGIVVRLNEEAEATEVADNVPHLAKVGRLRNTAQVTSVNRVKYSSKSIGHDVDIHNQYIIR